MRTAVAHLPPAVHIYLHKDLKARFPEVVRQIGKFNPQADGIVLVALGAFDRIRAGIGHPSFHLYVVLVAQ